MPHRVVFSIPLIAFVIAPMAFVPAHVSAATASMYLVPATRLVEKGETFSVELYADTNGREVNAGEGELFFDPNELEVVYISKLNSIFTFWAPEPDFSNASGVIRFGGGSAVGYVGERGLIIGITFKARTTGAMRVSFRSGALIAADGKGTNIVEQLRSGVYTVIEKTAGPVAEGYRSPSGAPDAPLIVSDTHPDEHTWYAHRSPRFSWSVPSDTAAVRFSVDQTPGSLPLVEYPPTMRSYAFDNLEDGIWYVHVQFKNNAGWGSIGHFRVQIDTQKPAILDISLQERSDETDPRIPLAIQGEDAMSGVDRYEIQIGNAALVTWRVAGSNVFISDPVGPGLHSAVVRAVDKAGNILVNSLDIFVSPIRAPEFTEYPRQLERDRILTVRGLGIPRARVAVWIQKEGEDPAEFVVGADEEGNFTYISEERLRDGLYELWAQSLDDRGARSYATEKIVFTVREPLVVRLGTRAVNALSIFIPLVALLIALVMVLWYGWHRVVVMRKKIQQELRRAEKTLHVEFELLRQDVEEHLAHLEQAKAARALTEEEHRFIEKFKKHLEKGERILGRDLRHAGHDAE